MNKLNKDVLNYTLEFLTNEEIINFIYINKEIYKLFDKKKIFEFMNTAIIQLYLIMMMFIVYIVIRD